MANVKTFYPVCAKRTVTTQSVAYSEKANIGKLVSIGLTPNVSDVKLYGDDDIAERAISFTDASLDVTVTEVPMAVAGKIFGATVSTDNEISFGDDDVPFVGFGFCRGELVGNETKYRAVWLPKVKFALPSETYETKGETIAFGTPKISASAQIDEATKKWRIEKEFDTIALAKAFIDTCATGTETID